MSTIEAVAAPARARPAPERHHGLGNLERLDTDMRHLLMVHAQMGGRPIEDARVAEARAVPTLAMALRRLLRDAPEDDQGVDMEMRLIPAPGGAIRARVYTPRGEANGPRPAILYFHGGFFILGDVDHYDATPRALARRLNAVVVSSHYRQAPESRFPAAHEDAYAAWWWINEQAEALGINPDRMALMGEDAGGNLAANVALRARGDGYVPAHLVLVSPIAGMSFDRPSHEDNADTYPINTATLQWASRKIFRRKSDFSDPRIALADRADLAALPPTTLILPEFDPLRSEGEAMFEAVARAGVRVNHELYRGVTHGFLSLARIVNKATFAQSRIVSDLRTSFSA